MMEDAVHFLSKETVVQAIARSATKVCTSVDEIAGHTIPIFHFVLVPPHARPPAHTNTHKLDQPTYLCFCNENKFDEPICPCFCFLSKFLCINKN
jgi:hypothetical protein